MERAPRATRESWPRGQGFLRRQVAELGLCPEELLGSCSRDATHRAPRLLDPSLVCAGRGRAGTLGASLTSLSWCLPDTAAAASFLFQTFKKQKTPNAETQQLSPPRGKPQGFGSLARLRACSKSAPPSLDTLCAPHPCHELPVGQSSALGCAVGDVPGSHKRLCAGGGS